VGTNLPLAVHVFAAVLFWNLVGAGLFGFLINPPIALYYMQGLNTTANHGHAALFGVYGMLGLGLTLYCMRGLTDVTRWNQKWIRISSGRSISALAVTFLSLLPQGILQTYASIEHGYAYARSAEFIHSPIMQALVWARCPATSCSHSVSLRSHGSWFRRSCLAGSRLQKRQPFQSRRFRSATPLPGCTPVFNGRPANFGRWSLPANTICP
jgi:hypothetical protein